MSASPPPDWTALTQALYPHRVLQIGPELDGLYAKVPYGPADHIERRLRRWQASSRGAPGDLLRTEPPPKFIFCGARGSGKTTQLRHLASGLVGSAEVVLLDLAPVLPDRASTLQLVAHMGLALLARLGEWDGADGGAPRVIATLEPAREFGTLLSDIVSDVDLAALVEAIRPALVATDLVSGGAVGTATTVLAAAKSTWRAVRDQLQPVQRLARTPALMRSLTGDQLGLAEALVRQVSILAAALDGRAGRPVVLLVDGLDKTERLEDVRVAFEDIEILRGLDAAVVLTGPTTLRHDKRFGGMRQDISIRLNNNFPVVTPKGDEREDGIDGLLDLLRRRLGTTLAGTVAPDAARLAARLSSGIAVEFLTLLRDAALEAEERGAERVEREDVLATAKQLRLILQNALTIDDVRVLEKVRLTGMVGGDQREQELLNGNFIACYPNNNAYFRPHELLVEWVAEVAPRLGTGD